MEAVFYGQWGIRSGFVRKLSFTVPCVMKTPTQRPNPTASMCPLTFREITVTLCVGMVVSLSGNNLCACRF